MLDAQDGSPFFVSDGFTFQFTRKEKVTSSPAKPPTLFSTAASPEILKHRVLERKFKLKSFCKIKAR